MRVLVTGGAGFIGSNLCEYFLGQGYEVVCLDNFSTGYQRNIEPYVGDASFRLVEGDICDLEACVEASKGCDYAFHHAALVSVPESVSDPIATNVSNVAGFVNVLEAARRNGLKRVIYASSSAVYGDSEVLPAAEGAEGACLSPYALTKRMNEEWADLYYRLYGLESIGLRYFNVYGRRQDPNGAYAAVIPIFVRRMMAGQPPQINGDGSYTRDFTYVDDVVQANVRAMEAGVEAVNAVYNVAYGEESSLNALVAELRAILSGYDAALSGIEAEYGPLREGDIAHSVASIGLLRERLGYRPEYPLSRGLREACRWYWENLK
ncbi:MAG: LPS biosynthesis protein WbpP [Bacteroidetes bacterium]|nr:MAG: LPS biosynthesis protein WbpP [Bacteroidota bacterium]